MSKFFKDILSFFFLCHAHIVHEENDKLSSALLRCYSHSLWRITLNFWVLSNQEGCHQIFKLQFESWPSKTHTSNHVCQGNVQNPPCMLSHVQIPVYGEGSLVSALCTAQIQAQTQ